MDAAVKLLSQKYFLFFEFFFSTFPPLSIENFPLAAIEDDKKPFTSDSHAHQYVLLQSNQPERERQFQDRPFCLFSFQKTIHFPQNENLIWCMRIPF